MTILTIDNEEWINQTYIKNKYNLTSHRVKRWRDGRGDAKNNILRYIRINRGQFLYNRKDLEILIDLLNKKKEK